jgi:hypothetical protein
MRSLFLSLVILAVSISVKAQNCTAPVSSIVFKQKFSQLAAMRHDQQRLASATEFVRKNCLLTYQVKQIAELFNDDITRLGFVQNAYSGIFDKENVYDLYDAFAYFSMVMRLHDFIEDQTQRPTRRGRYSDMPDEDYSFPNYNYPSYENYRDKTPCSQPLSDEVFMRLLRNVAMHHDDDSRILAAMQLVENNCLTVAQIMKMGSFIEKEVKRLDYLKRTYDYTYDVGNFQYSNQLLKEKTYTTEFDNFIRERRSRPGRDNNRQGPGRNTCMVSDTEMQDILNNIKAQSFENTQITVAKQIVRSKQCFTTLQIKQLVEVFSFEKSKLDMAKYCYAYCIDRNDYYKINNSFSFSSSVEELTKYISEQE